MNVRTGVWRLGRLLLFVAVLGVTFLVSFGVSMRVALRSREVRVPELLGQSVSDATRVTADFGLGLRIDPNERPSDRVPAGRIMQQEPPGGDLARRQRTVRVWVSSGPHVTVVPQLEGQSERTARIRVAQEGLSVASLAEIRSSAYDADVVVAHDPPAQTGSGNVALLINRGEDAPDFVMPDVIGMDAAQAADTLRGLGFRVSIAATPVAGIPAGTVVRQQPSGGFRVSLADPISLEASR